MAAIIRTLIWQIFNKWIWNCLRYHTDRFGSQTNHFTDANLVLKHHQRLVLFNLAMRAVSYVPNVSQLASVEFRLQSWALVSSSFGDMFTYHTTPAFETYGSVGASIFTQLWMSVTISSNTSYHFKASVPISNLSHFLSIHSFSPSSKPWAHTV